MTGSDTLIALERIEGLVGVADERKAHLRLLFLGHGAGLSTVLGAGVFLGNLVNGEVGNVDVRRETGFERGPDLAKLLPDDTAEEGMVLDLGGSAVLTTFLADTVFRIAEEAGAKDISMFMHTHNIRGCTYLRIRCSESRERTISSGK